MQHDVFDPTSSFGRLSIVCLMRELLEEVGASLPEHIAAFGPISSHFFRKSAWRILPIGYQQAYHHVFQMKIYNPEESDGGNHREFSEEVKNIVSLNLVAKKYTNVPVYKEG